MRIYRHNYSLMQPPCAHSTGFEERPAANPQKIPAPGLQVPQGITQLTSQQNVCGACTKPLFKCSFPRSKCSSIFRAQPLVPRAVGARTVRVALGDVVAAAAVPSQARCLSNAAFPSNTFTFSFPFSECHGVFQLQICYSVAWVPESLKNK